MGRSEMEILNVSFEDGSGCRLTVTKLGCLFWTLVAVAVTTLIVALCGCPGQVTTYTTGPGGASPGGAGAGGSSVPANGADAGPDAGQPGCVEHAQCWPLGYCSPAHGICSPQDGAMCLVGQDLQDCGTGVCCILAPGQHECRPLSDCEPEGEAIP